MHGARFRKKTVIARVCASPSWKSRSGVWTFAFGFAAGLAALFGFALVMALRGL
jgi:hypothetical protein